MCVLHECLYCSVLGVLTDGRINTFLANVNVLRYVCYMLSAVRLSSVCLSVVCDVGAPYSGG